MKVPSLFGQIIIPGTYIEEDILISNLKNDSIKEIIYHPSIKSSAEKLEIVDPLLVTSFNSKYARSYNDGPTWKGRGLTQEAHFGITFKKGVFQSTFVPVVYFSQNTPYELAEINQFKNPYNYQFRQMSGSAANVDFVQRFGNQPFIKFSLGQTDLRLNLKPISIGVSTQNFTLGPAIRNHLIMSNGSEGFPHTYLKTKEKINLKIGDIDLGYLESFLFMGLLKESDFFDTNRENNQRFINGLSVGYELPKKIGFSIGFSRVLYKNSEVFEKRDLYSLFYIKDNGVLINDQGDTIKNTGNDLFDQLASAFIQWKIPGQNVRLFFELGKNDFTGPFRWTVTEFEHNRLYTLGLEKLWFTRKGEFYLSYEHTYLPFFKNYIYRPTNSAYTHTEARQGYTHKGQLLGPGIGPGSVSDFTQMKWQRESFSWSILLSRIRFDEDYFITQIPNNGSKIDRHDVEYSFGSSFLRKSKKLDWGLNTTFSYRFNTYFEWGNDKKNAFIQAFARLKI